jgi:outer membrane protein assembly factor BamB
MSQIEILQVYDAPGRGPAGLAWNGRFLFNADYTNGSIYQIDPTTGQSVGRLTCPGNLSGLTWNGSALWQSLHDGGALSRINPETNDFDQSIWVFEHGWLSGVAWDGAHLWAASQQKGKLFVLDQDSGDVVRTVPAPIAGGGLDYHDGSLWLGIPYPMRFNEQYHYFDWVGEAQHFAIVQLNPSDGEEIGRYELPFLPMGIAWVNNELWLSHAAERKLFRARLT